jgi:2,4-dienoyl-CoA reductase-like NADH-dependent reductase (Old Yellow Enzyme family)
VEITSFMGYLLSSFNSGVTNVRTDEYGGSVENRGKFMVEVIREIKETIGDDRPLIVRLNGVEVMDEFGGNTPEECLEFMKMAERAGADCISLVIGWDIIPTWKWRHDKWIEEFSIQIHAESQVEEISDKGVRIHNREGEESFIDADTIVQAGPRMAQQDLLERLEFSVDEIYIIGDAVRPRSIHNAIHGGFKIGARI